MPSPILARADALMQRRRPGGPDGEDVPVLTDAVESEEDDIPVLLEVADAAPAEPTFSEAFAEAVATPASVVETPTEADPSFDRALLDIVAHELARRVNARLNAELPAIIEATVRDFLAEREILDLLRPRD